jgi:hypothetical protein
MSSTPLNELGPALLQRYSAISTQLEAEIGERPLVLPNGTFFPDLFQHDALSVERLLRRMLTHAGMDDVPVRTQLAGAPQSGGCKTTGSCGTGACGPGATPSDEEEAVTHVRDDGDGWTIVVAATDLRNPVVLTSHLARCLGLVLLHEALEPRQIPAPLATTAELTAVALGFGVLLLEASYLYSKGCSGPSVACATALPCDELALAVGAFIVAGGARARDASKELSLTQREALDEALHYIRSRPALETALRHDLPSVARGDVSYDERKGLRLWPFGKRRSERGELDLAALERDLAELPKKPVRRAEPDPEREEIRALVDEAFASHER